MAAEKNLENAAREKEYTINPSHKKTIAFTPNKNAPPDHPEGALYQNWSL